MNLSGPRTGASLFDLMVRATEKAILHFRLTDFH
jgi:hypothetical protein